MIRALPFLFLTACSEPTIRFIDLPPERTVHLAGGPAQSCDPLPEGYASRNECELRANAPEWMTFTPVCDDALRMKDGDCPPPMLNVGSAR
jgi:hypothetical protein